MITKYLRQLLNGIAMYRLVLIGLVVMAAWAMVLSIAHKLPYTPLSLILSGTVLVITAMSVNAVFARIFKTTSNIESSAITAMILFFIFTPESSIGGAWTLFFAATTAVSFKYILTWHKTHIVNPAALSAVIIGTISGTAHWWVATIWMLPITLLIGTIIATKVRRGEMIMIFIATVLIMNLFIAPIITHTPLKNFAELANTIRLMFVSWPLIFFGTFMLTEPLTTPPTKSLRTLYAVIVGVLFVTPIQLSQLSMTPELALILGNAFAYFWQPRHRFLLTLKNNTQLTDGIYEFTFNRPHDFSFIPGQYMEWTFGHSHADSRGNRRYFSIASSPLERIVRVIMRIPPQASTYKQSLLAMKPGDQIVASHASGDFTLPSDASKKLVFIAGGVGITPFSSMVRHMITTQEYRDAVLFYSSKSVADYVDVSTFHEAERLGLSSVYIPSDTTHLPSDWRGPSGLINEQILTRYTPDFATRTFYISGPPPMVQSYEELLQKVGIPKRHIHTDYFTGY